MEYKTISLIDLKAQYERIGDELDLATLNVLRNTQYIMGHEVKQFEQEFSAFLGAKHSISVGNGTDALVIALEALGIGEGDEVITTPYTFFATAESISYVGAKPVFVDVDPQTFNMDPSLIEKAITPHTKAIMPVHLFGLSCDMDPIMAIAQKHGLFVIEDACQAVGGTYRERKLGTIGHISCFSFFPTKNLGAAGDGGMIVTNDDALATICRALRAHGSGENGQSAYHLLNHIKDDVTVDTNTDNTVYNPLKYFNYLVGHNSRLDEIQAAILRVKLRHLDSWNQLRHEHARYYSEQLEQWVQNSHIRLPYEPSYASHVYHMYILQSESKDALIEFLKKKGIATGVYYPVPLHLQKAFVHLGYKEGDFPNSEYLSFRTFAIPMFAELTLEQQDYILDAIKEYGESYGR